MARHSFGGSLTDWTFALGDTATSGSGVTGPAALVQTGVTVTCWSAQSGGSQYTDLVDNTGVPVSSITSDAATGEIPPFQGPDNEDGGPEVVALWADAGAGRMLMVATDLGDAVTDLTARMASAEADLSDARTQLAAAPVFVDYNTTSGSYPPRPDTGKPVYWVGPVPPAFGIVDGVQYAVDGLDKHFGPST